MFPTRGNGAAIHLRAGQLTFANFHNIAYHQVQQYIFDHSFNHG